MKDRIHNLADKKTLRQKLRSAPTRAERALWRALQRSALGYKFRRQHGVGRYVLDFCCPDLKLAIELEGGIHRDVIRSECDALRHAFLISQGIRILYFRNEVVFEYMDRVLEAIRAAAEGRI
jgi:very-short-patch-repair endonuclease